MAQRTTSIRVHSNQERGKSLRCWNREDHIRHRDYSPTLGRFIERDPIGFEAGDGNWYRFVANGPTNASDPTGLIDTVGQKIMHRLFSHVISGVFSLSLLNRGAKLFIDSYPIIDEQGEMKRAFDPNMKFYYRMLGEQLVADRKLTNDWKPFRIDRDDVLPGQWQFGLRPKLSTSWWLGGAHSVDADVALEARCHAGRIEMRNIQALWNWNDAIDANSVVEWWNEKGTWWGRVKGIPNLIWESVIWDLVFDKVLDTDFKVQVFWPDKLNSLSVPTP